MLGSAWVLYLLVALSIASIGAMFERWLFFRKRKGGEDLCDELCELLEQGEKERARELLRGSPTIEAEVLRASLRWAHGGPAALEAAIDGQMTKRRRELERGMTLLGTLGNNAPFVGLLGTVIGVIVAFADLAEGTSNVQMNKVMGGIAEALVATGVGLLVAIPAVVGYNIFQKKITDIEDNVASISRRLSAFIAVGKAEDFMTPSMMPPPVKLAADSVRDLADMAGDGDGDDEEDNGNGGSEPAEAAPAAEE